MAPPTSRLACKCSPRRGLDPSPQVRLWDGTAGGASTALFKLHDGDQVTGLAASAPVDERARLYVSAASGAIYALGMALGIDDDATALTAVAIGSGGTVGDARANG